MPSFAMKTLKSLPALALAALSALAASTLTPAPHARASSDFDGGVLHRRDPVTGSDLSVGVCRLFVGPRGDVPAGRFLLRIGDETLADGYELELAGDATPDGAGGWVLGAERADAEDFYEQVLHRVLRLQRSEFELRELTVEVDKDELDLAIDDVTCELRLTGSILTDPKPLAALAPSSRARRLPLLQSGSPVHLRYRGAGTAFEPVPGAATQATSTTAANGCPTPNYTPVPDKCGTPNCMVTFAGYQWWTEYNYFPPPTYFYNNNNAWAPQNVTVDAEGLHLFVRQQDLGAGPNWAAAEAVTALNPDGSQAMLGYGTYLVTATVQTAPSWAEMDTHVAFGAFTYERDRTGDANNPGRELDLAEISRWGNTTGGCRVSPPALCPGNAQFTVQLWDANPANLHRYSIDAGVQTVTLVMQWTAANQPVTFSQYDGAYTLDDLPATPANTWTTSADQNPFIPASGCQQFHLNLWMGDFTDASGGYNPPPASVQEVVVSNFQYRP